MLNNTNFMFFSCFSVVVSMITIISVSAPLLLLLLVLTVVFLVCRRRKQAEKSEDLVHFQSVCAQSYSTLQ